MERAIRRDLKSARITFDYASYGSVVSLLEPLLGQSGWLELSKLTISSLDVEEFVVLTGIADDGNVPISFPGMSGNQSQSRLAVMPLWFTTGRKRLIR